jgi:ubiquitin conjugation factor E4 B
LERLGGAEPAKSNPIEQNGQTAAAAAAPIKPELAPAGLATSKIEEKRPVSTVEHKSKPPSQSYQQWEHQTIKETLRVTLVPSPDESCVVLGDIAQEVVEEQGDAADFDLKSSQLDRLFWSRLTEHKCLPSVFDYLLGCWSRAANAKRLLKPSIQDHQLKTSLLSEIQRFTVDFAVVSATADPEEGGLHSNLGERLVSKSSTNRSPMPWEFVQSIVGHAEDQGLLVEVLTPIFTYLCKGLSAVNLAKQSTSMDYKPFFAVMENLISIKSVAGVITQLDGFHITGEAIPPALDKFFLLGPFLGVSIIEGAQCLANFPDPDTITQPRIDRVAMDVRAELKVIQDRLFFICDKIVRGSPTSRIGLLKYFGDILNLNHKRTAMHAPDETISSDGFMLNITFVLTKLCEPFTDLYGTKIDKISSDYFRLKNHIIDISEETKLVSDLQTSKDFYSQTIDQDANFISHVFFLSCGFYHYGLGGIIQSHGRTKRLVDELQHRLAGMEAERARYLNEPAATMFRNALKRLQDTLRMVQAKKLSLQCVLYDIELQRTFLDFTVFQLMFMIRAAEPTHGYPQQKLTLPFSEDAPEIFKNYPEYMIEAPVSFVIFLCRFLPQMFAMVPQSQIVVFCVVFLRNTSYIKNPYLKSKLVEVLFYGSIEFQNGHKGHFVNMFDTEPLCLDHLFHSLMNFYIEVEQTGASSQFYDKFNTRYYISQIIKCIWANNIYRSKLEKESLEDVDFFVHFVALLLNDVTYLLDESLTKLTEIHKLQGELANHPPDPNEDQETREKRDQLASAEKHASSYMQLTNQTVTLCKLFTSAVAKAFVKPEIVDRLAAMLNYNLAALVGPKCRELKVQNPEKYGFNPRELLSQLCDVYLNLEKEPSFVKAVARDGRSYNPGNLDRAKDILGKWASKSPADLQRLVEFKQATEQTKMEDEQGELELGDVPDEFLDPLMYTLMEEPVILPSSKVTIDLGTIKSHLLSDAKDPFNRMPLKIEDVIPNVELKDEIERFKKEQREKYRQANITQMDTTE